MVDVGMYFSRGFPGSSAGKESSCNADDPGLIPGSGRSPGEGIGTPVFSPGECYGQRSLAGYITHNALILLNWVVSTLFLFCCISLMKESLCQREGSCTLAPVHLHPHPLACQPRPCLSFSFIHALASGINYIEQRSWVRDVISGNFSIPRYNQMQAIMSHLKFISKHKPAGTT